MKSSSVSHGQNIAARSISQTRQRGWLSATLLAALAVLAGLAVPGGAQATGRDDIRQLPGIGERLRVDIQAKAATLTLAGNDYTVDLEGRLAVRTRAGDPLNPGSVRTRLTAFELSGESRELGRVKAALVDADSLQVGVFEPDPGHARNYRHTLWIKLEVRIAKPPAGIPNRLVMPEAVKATASGLDTFPPTAMTTGWGISSPLTLTEARQDPGKIGICMNVDELVARC